MPSSKTIQAPAGQRTVIQRRRFSSMPSDYQFTVEPAQPGQAVAGKLEISASAWIFPNPVRVMPLQERHSVSAGMWNTFFSIAVVPEVDVVLTRTDGKFSGEVPLFRVGYLIALAVLIALALGLMIYVSSAG